MGMVPVGSLGGLPTGHWAGPWAGKVSPRPKQRGAGTDHSAASGFTAGTELQTGVPLPGPWVDRTALDHG